MHGVVTDPVAEALTDELVDIDEDDEEDMVSPWWLPDAEVDEAPLLLCINILDGDCPLVAEQSKSPTGKLSLDLSIRSRNKEDDVS